MRAGLHVAPMKGFHKEILREERPFPSGEHV